jgi:hypothetical protein
MRANLLIALTLGGALALAACSDKTENSATATVNSAGNDTEANFDATGNAIENGWDATKDAASDAGNKVDNAID